MNQAFNKTHNRHEDLSKIYGGDPYLYSIAANDFKCSDSTCLADVILCSYGYHNLIAPYFKTKAGHSHRNGCPNTIISLQYDPLDISNPRYVGQAAYNAIRGMYLGTNTRSTSLYNTSTGTRTPIPRVNVTNIRVVSKAKTGPIIYDGSSNVFENTTYLSALSDGTFNINVSDRIYLNFEGVGLVLTAQTKKSIEVDPANTKIIFISKYIRETNGRKYCGKPNILVIREGKIVHEQSWRDFNNYVPTIAPDDTDEHLFELLFKNEN